MQAHPDASLSMGSALLPARDSHDISVLVHSDSLNISVQQVILSTISTHAHYLRKGYSNQPNPWLACMAWYRNSSQGKAIRSLISCQIASAIFMVLPILLMRMSLICHSKSSQQDQGQTEEADLEHDCAACSQSRCGLPCSHEQREVERCDLPTPATMLSRKSSFLPIR